MSGTIKQYVMGGVCALTIGGVLLCTQAEDTPGMTIVLDTETDLAAAETATVAADDGIVISFTAVPSGNRNGMVVFQSNDITVVTDLDDYKHGEPVTISGVISEIGNSVVVLTDCAISESTDDTATLHEVMDISANIPDRSAEHSYTDEYTVQAQECSVTVYVSSTGKYHSKSDCSGMKNYTEVSLAEAIEQGNVACKRCY